MKHKKIFRLRTILLIANLTVLLIPLGSIFFFRIYENQLVRQTERELISQASVIAAIYKNEVKKFIGSDKTFGTQLNNLKIETLDDFYTPVIPQLELSETEILPPRPKGLVPKIEIDFVSNQVGMSLSPIISDIKKVVLSGVKVLDFNGIVIAGSNELGQSFSHLKEIQLALKGSFTSVIRERIPNHPPPSLASISRGTNIRVFSAFPILEENHLWGIVYISRTPKNILKDLYMEKEKVIMISLVIIGLTLLLVFFTSYTISRPIYQLIERTKKISQGNKEAIRPLEKPITKEMELLSKSFNDMAISLNKRSEYIRDFATHVSHEFKTPLTSIQGAGELLLEHFSNMPENKKKKFIDNIVQDSKRLKELVSKLLYLAKLDNLTPSEEQSNLGNILNKLKEHWAREGIEISFEEDPKIILKFASDYLEAALTNLISNSKQHKATFVKLSFLRMGENLILNIQDNGEGIPNSHKDKIFAPFFTTKRENGGTGLGLGIVKSLVEAHGGKISLADSKTGARFKVSLPLII